jgi:hypothetical protein
LARAVALTAQGIFERIVVYAALYAWLVLASDETHNWPLAMPGKAA